MLGRGSTYFQGEGPTKMRRHDFVLQSFSFFTEAFSAIIVTLNGDNIVYIDQVFFFKISFSLLTTS